MAAREAVIVGAVRTPVGRRGGALRNWHPVDLLGQTLRTLVDRTGVDASLIDDVIAGCVLQNEEQGGNLGRHAVLAAGLPESVPAVTVDRQCGSGQQAVSFAAQAIVADCADLVIACGVESMSRVPMPPAMRPGAPLGPQYSPRELVRYNVDSERGELMAQGASSELMNARFGLTRAELDDFSARSHERAWAATQAGRFAAQLVPLTIDPADPASDPITADPPNGQQVEHTDGYTVTLPIGPKGSGSSYRLNDNATQQAFPLNYRGAAKVHGRNVYEYNSTGTGAVKSPSLLKTLPPALPGTIAAQLMPKLPPASQEAIKQAGPIPSAIPLSYVATTNYDLQVDKQLGSPLAVAIDRTVTAYADLGGKQIELLPVLQLNVKTTDKSVALSLIHI